MRKLFLFCLLVLSFTPRLISQTVFDSLLHVHEDLSEFEQIRKLNLFSIHNFGRNPKLSEEIATSTLKMARQLKHDSLTGEVYLLIAYANKMQSRFSGAIKYSNTALRYFRKINDFQRIGFIHNLIGEIYKTEGLTDSSLFYYLKGIDELNSLEHGNPDDRNTIALKCVLFTNIGLLYHFQLHNSEKSRQYFNDVLNLSSKIGDSIRMTASFSNLGMVEKNEKNYDKALSYYQQALEMAKSLQNMSYVSNILNNIGSLFIEKGEFDKGISYVLKGYDISKSLGDIYSQSMFLRYIGNHYLEHKDYSLALDYFRQSMYLSSGIDADEERKETYFQLSQTFEMLEKPDSALVYYKKYIEIEKKMNAIKNEEQFNEMLVKYEADKKEKENEMLAYANRKQKTIQRYLIFLSMALVIILVFSIIMFQQVRKNIQRKKTMAEQANSALQERLDFRNRELTSKAMHLLELNSLTESIAINIKESYKHCDQFGKDMLRRIVNEVELHVQQDAWKEFEVYFENVHSNFFMQLNSLHPELSPSEVKICAFLKLNMSSKDIASLTNRSYRTIETVRTNIRKKMNLATEVNLVNYLMKIA